MAKTNRFTDKFKEANKAFRAGPYQEGLDALKGFTPEQLKDILPKTTDAAVYQKLIAVVEDASTKNKKQAELLDDIKELGDVAVSIAKKVPQLAALFK